MSGPHSGKPYPKRFVVTGDGIQNRAFDTLTAAKETGAELDVANDEDGGHEARLLLSIAWHESRHVRAVGECTSAKALESGRGALGAWQVVPRPNGGDEKRRACIVTFAALLARDRVREIVEACSSAPDAERLAVYAGGRCDLVAARFASRVRWVD